ncbi:IS1595 family transposase [Bradyrhizobium sp. Arg816]|uniref:IS1595 family transposase n=1 Tax=Bradyrhizobium sp. Arg816 TaxID=2998491 RepID=UPI00249EFF95|nr:IS1595 family transposase [Bradyrhizobium sp. Arg816]MDI3566573.1 IS1595 family transposase [Bradyrhizobium sp. Arg816]
MSNLQNPIFTDETKAREWLEARVWPNGPACPHCGNVDQDKIKALQGKAHRPGLYQCAACREQFTVTVKTVFERSKIPLSKWLAALFLLTASKKGISAHQMHRMLGISYKSTWFMMHRLREALRTGGLLPPMGEGGKAVEVDETFFGRLEGQKKGKAAWAHKNVVMTLVERGGSARSFHVDGVRTGDLLPIIRENLSREAQLMTDEAASYKIIADIEGLDHSSVKHSKDEYVRRDGDKVISTNTVEGYYSIFKRGMKGVYQHCGEKHLHRYLAEFDFRYSNRTALGVDDYTRAEIAAKGIVGKRLTYRRPNSKKDTPSN